MKDSVPRLPIDRVRALACAALALAWLVAVAPDRVQAMAGDVPATVRADRILVLKGERRLLLLRDGKVLKSYPIALGRNPKKPKVSEGDGRTPEGFYTIEWRNPDSRFYRSLRISYPNWVDRLRAYQVQAPPGHSIMIHGLPNGRTARSIRHPRSDWTDGCIAVTNAEMDEIWEAVEIGTPIVIRP